MIRMRCHCALVVQHIPCDQWSHADDRERQRLKSCHSSCPKMVCVCSFAGVALYLYQSFAYSLSPFMGRATIVSLAESVTDVQSDKFVVLPKIIFWQTIRSEFV